MDKVAIVARSGRGGRRGPQQARPVDDDKKRMDVALVPCSEMQGTLVGVGRCDRGVSTFNGAFRSGLAPCGRDCRIVGEGKWKGSA